VWRRRKGLPEEWRDIVEANVAVWQRLDDAERASLRDRCDGLLRHKHWEASTGFALTDEIRVTVAALAALLVMNLDLREYEEVSAIIVYPSAMQSRGEYAGPVAGTVSDGVVPVIGQAHDRRGPVLLAWDEVLAAARTAGTGHNVVFHEFAHKLDMADNLLDGTPRLRERGDLARWVEVCTEAFQALRAGVDRPPLQPYGATNPSEFFAVATEAFFDVPNALRHSEPNLYDVMRSYYRQDPASRMSS
jgi:Mlc titration factor MtfA (ptsG expression regulator)